MWNPLFKNYSETQDCTGSTLNQEWAPSEHGALCDYTGCRPTKPALSIRKKIFSVSFSFGIYETPPPSPVSSPRFITSSSSILSHEGLHRTERNPKRVSGRNGHLHAKQATIITGDCKKGVQNPSFFCLFSW